MKTADVNEYKTHYDNFLCCWIDVKLAMTTAEGNKNRTHYDYVVELFYNSETFEIFRLFGTFP